MATKAKVNVIGRVGKLEMKYSPQGKLLAEVSIANNYKVDGKEVTDWYSCTFWEKSAELFNRFAKVSTLVSVDGVLEVRKWDSKDGNKGFELIIQRPDFNVLKDGKTKEESAEDQSTPYDGE